MFGKAQATFPREVHMAANHMKRVQGGRSAAGSKWKPAQPATSHYRRLAKLQFMVWQVVLYCAAASGTGTAGSAQYRTGDLTQTRKAGIISGNGVRQRAMAFSQAGMIESGA